jgi:hypothetical protein
VYGHCASGFSEVWDVSETLDEAKSVARKALKDYPVTPCGTGGVEWCEIFGPGIEESIGIERDKLSGELIETGI